MINNFNYDAFLGHAVDSALAQSYSDVEVIVVDDGSQDESVKIIEGYGDQIISVLKANGGQASAINAGFEATSGDLVLFLDSDDYLFPHAVDAIASEWEEASSQPGAPTYVQVQSRLDLVGAEGQRIDLYPAPEIPFDQGDVTSLLLQKGRYNTTSTSGLGFSRLALQRVLPIPEDEFRISADGYLVSTAPFFGHVLAVETSVGARRKHDTNAWSVSDMAQKVEQLGRSVEHDFDRYKYLARTADELGFSPRPNLEMFDYLHLQDRLAYLRLGPTDSSSGSGSASLLSMRGVRAIINHTQFSWSRKFVLCLWFLWLGFAPRSWASTAVRWKFFRSTRPRWIDRLLNAIRHLSRRV